MIGKTTKLQHGRGGWELGYALGDGNCVMYLCVNMGQVELALTPIETTADACAVQYSDGNNDNHNKRVVDLEKIE
jgi:hypothetical protein